MLEALFWCRQAVRRSTICSHSHPAISTSLVCSQPEKQTSWAFVPWTNAQGSCCPSESYNVQGSWIWVARKLSSTPRYDCPVTATGFHRQPFVPSAEYVLFLLTSVRVCPTPLSKPAGKSCIKIGQHTRGENRRSAQVKDGILLASGRNQKDFSCLLVFNLVFYPVFDGASKYNICWLLVHLVQPILNAFACCLELTCLSGDTGQGVCSEKQRHPDLTTAATKNM